MEVIKKLISKHRNLLFYGIMGATGALVDFIIYSLLVNLTSIAPVTATILSTSAGIVVSFSLNSKYNFKKTNYLLYRFAAFYSVGLIGLLLSVVLIFTMYNVFGVNATLAKLITIPPVVLAQFFVNKHVSFSENPKNFWRRFFKGLRGNYLIILFNILYLSIIAFTMYNTVNISSIPESRRNDRTIASQPPDEVVHYRHNVQFILNNNRLPESGKDDVEALSFCHNREHGKATCQYSYQIYPGTPYLIAALGAKYGVALGMTPSMGARLPGFIYALIMINSIYAATLLITRSKKASLLFTGILSLIPQVIYTLSYLNLDGFSLAVASLVLLGAVRYTVKPELKSVLLLAFSTGGLLSVSKFNFMILALPAAATVAYLAIKNQQHRKLLPKLIIASVVSFLLVGAFWYARNLSLYGDLTGQTFVINEMSKYHTPGKTAELSLETWADFTEKEFLGQTFRSFIGAFGSMTHFLQAPQYEIVGFAVIVLSSLLLYRAYSIRNRTLALLWFVTLATVTGSILLSLYNSLIYDFQPQGRYIFAALFPFIAMLAYHWRVDKSFRAIHIIFGAIAVYLFLLGTQVFIRAYF